MPRRRALFVAGLLLALAGGGAHAADPSKVLRVAFPVAETGFDPQAVSDLYSNYVNRSIFDPLYKYDHLARPYRIVPNTAAALPEISPDGLVWTIRLKPGTYFSEDAAFKGQRRELVAADYLYSWKRVIDPKMRSPQLQVFDGLFVGADEAVARAKEVGRFDYDAPIEGLRALDRYTLRLHLTHPNYELLADLTSSGTAAVARDVVEAYGDTNGWTVAHPVGTGPYRLKDWRRGQKIVLEASPTFRDERFPDSRDPADQKIVAALKGKRLPMIGQVEINIIEETHPRLIAFEKATLDYVAIPSDVITTVVGADNKPLPRFAQAGVTLARGVQPAITYTYFNMTDPMVGGYGTDRVALRRAIGMAYNTDEDINVLRHGQAVPATQVIPPGVTGYNPKFQGRARHDPAAARALLDKFGYVDRDGDGFRDQPDGKPLVLRMGTTPSSRDREVDELWVRSLKAIGVRVEFVNQKWPDLLKMAMSNQLQMWRLGNQSTTTEGYGFLGLLYGGHAGTSNLARFAQPDFDRLYDRSRSLPDGPERTKLFEEMSNIVSAYAPWMLNVYQYENIAVYPWVQGYKYNAFNAHPWMYFDIDTRVPRRPVAP